MRSKRMTRTGAFLSARAAARPPNPPPTMMTCGCVLCVWNSNASFITLLPYRYRLIVGRQDTLQAWDSPALEALALASRRFLSAPMPPHPAPRITTCVSSGLVLVPRQCGLQPGTAAHDAAVGENRCCCHVARTVSRQEGHDAGDLPPAWPCGPAGSRCPASASAPGPASWKG